MIEMRASLMRLNSRLLRSLLSAALLALFSFASLSAGEIHMQEKVAYGGWPNCIRLSNGQIELIATTDVGPRLIRFGFVGGSNFMKEYADQAGKTGGDEWRIYGGHRLWQAPEDLKKTYAPDNGPVAHAWNAGTLKLTQPVDATGIEKEIEITMDAKLNRVTLVHRLTNRGTKKENLAVWALSAMAAGGRAIFPQEAYRSHSDQLLPVRAMALWGYTDMKDPRWSWGTHYIQLRQDSAMATPQKLGMTNTLGWAAYALDKALFINRFGYESSAQYPDFNSNCETYTDATMLEVETLGPMTQLAPGESVEHTEEWNLFHAEVSDDEAAIGRTLLPLIQQTSAVK